MTLDSPSKEHTPRKKVRKLRKKSSFYDSRGKKTQESFNPKSGEGVKIQPLLELKLTKYDSMASQMVNS